MRCGNLSTEKYKPTRQCVREAGHSSDHVYFEPGLCNESGAAQCEVCKGWLLPSEIGRHVCHAVGRKDDYGKTRFDLLPWRGLDLVAQVLTKGAEKYAPENWRKVEGWRWRYFRAAIGHLAKWRSGEKLDPEWGLPHLAHAACCVLFMLELDD